MITPKKKICVECGKLDYYFSRKRCKSCSSKDYKKVNKISDKQAEQNKILHTIYGVMDSNTNKKCFFCGSTNNLSHCHLIRRSYSQKLIVHPLNIVHACLDCHKIADDKPKEKIYLPNYIELLKRIILLDETYFNIEINNIKENDINKYNEFILKLNL